MRIRVSLVWNFLLCGKRAMSVEKNWLKTREDIRMLCQNANRKFEDITLLAVTKKASLEQIKELVHLGQRHFGENRLDHLKEMATSLKDDNVVWHFIGHLQCNKVDEVLKICLWVQSVDSLRLIKKLQETAQKYDRRVNVLIQLNLSGEAQKTGFKIEELELASQMIVESSHLVLRGLMCMAPVSDHPAEIKAVFDMCAHQFSRMKTQFNLKDSFDTLSMGMSDDYPLAIASGTTQVRIGFALYTV